MAIRASYSPNGKLGWGGVYWQHPENNWGNIEGGIDLSWANKLSFWAKGEKGGEKIRFFVGGIGTKHNSHPDSLRPEVSTGYIQLTDSWRQYTINLLGQNLSRVIGGFGWSTDKCANLAGATFFLDDIIFTFDPNLPIPPALGPAFPVYTDAAAPGNHYFPTGWMGDGKKPGHVSLNECWNNNPHSGQNAIKVDYKRGALGWAGVYWLHPAENWGDRPGGFDLSGASRLTFWARSETSDTPQIEFFVGGVACLTSEPYPDSVCPAVRKKISLSSVWTKYTIDLPQPLDLSRVVGGFGWSTNESVSFLLDDIVYGFD
jgi:hypothetical protein